MKIHIENVDESNTFGVQVFDVKNQRHITSKSRLTLRHWNDDWIRDLLGFERYKLYLNGKFSFDVSRKEIFEASEDMFYYKSNY